MLEILPVEDKVIKESLCLRFGLKFDQELMAYVAYRNGAPVGMCRFTFKNGEGILVDLSTAETSDEQNILFSLGIAALNFIDQCGALTAKCEKKCIDPSILSSLGLHKIKEETYESKLRENG